MEASPITFPSCKPDDDHPTIPWFTGHGQPDLYINIANQDILFRANWVRLNQALFLSSKRIMESLYQHGPDDGLNFYLKKVCLNRKLKTL